ncbi:putative bifunctional methylthioribulose-1-phosphate dehydratase/enolase-phosphatase E1 [Tetrabaena socialis]|uniref:Putative bifunctional methylthioribulose-1-phosphate dehydratase/enolase-phosphatase E1 n=1 Tax=Tetrabaena socialis TaxID=47790 RepID=A0A2J8A3V4_9CHLO|nr:putative bifunctional methylthioribulose-1-phosphate dehydratase/enolase-phosphatase E1 [Tetrabaena socialis]|eukprot:PNH07187.1 putative bifunctional methylthioribulose-1-phosphate dehydratase/enolase-phosphatase E1 [Tetrabaena socialis]
MSCAGGVERRARGAAAQVALDAGGQLLGVVGDLRPYLCGFFDTTAGLKAEPASYANIALSLGTDAPADILFATDSLPEAQAAAAAGWRAVLVERPGNKELPEGHGFRVISSMQELL